MPRLICTATRGGQVYFESRQNKVCAVCVLATPK